MKTLSVLIFFLFSGFVYGQNQQAKSNFLFELEYNYGNFTKTQNSYFYNFSQSNGGSFNLKYDFGLSSKLSVLAGLSFAEQKISSNMAFNQVNDKTEVTYLGDNDYYENNFSFKQIGIPLSVRYHLTTNYKVNFNFDATYMLSFLMNDQYNISTKLNNTITTVSDIDNPNLNNIQHLISLRANIEKGFCSKLKLSFFIHYDQSVSALFKTGEGPKLGYNIYGLGVSLIFL